MALTDKLTAIGNAIREKTGKTDLIPLSDMPNEILNISGGSSEENPLYYMDIKGFQWNKKAFPENYNFVIKLKDKPSDLNAMLSGATGLKTVTIICDKEGTVNYGQLIRDTAAEILDLSEFKPTPTGINYLAYNAESLVSISGILDLSQCTTATSAFTNATALKNVEFAKDSIKISISFNYCNYLTKESITSVVNGLDNSVTGQTITFSKTAVNNAFGIDVNDESTYTDEFITLINSKNNWEISFQ